MLLCDVKFYDKKLKSTKNKKFNKPKQKIREN